MLTSAATILPNKARSFVRSALASVMGLTVTQGWEEYAKKYRAEPGKHLGDEWNEPEILGIDVSAGQMVQALDERVFQPFLGTCDVMLEIGSGGGRFTAVLLPKCRKLIAADTSPTMLSLVRDRFADCPSLEAVLLDGRGLAGIPDHSVDAAFSFDVFVHLMQWDIYNYVCELKRVLRPGGKALIHHSNTFSELGWKQFVSDVPRQLNMSKDWGTLSLMSPQIMEEFARHAGLNLIECKTDVVRRDCISLLQAPASPDLSA